MPTSSWQRLQPLRYVWALAACNPQILMWSLLTGCAALLIVTWLPPQPLCRLDTAYHSVTAMVGAGVLGLPQTLGTLGWAGGLIMLTATFWMSWYTYKLLVGDQLLM
jgi:hypothetical protein